MIRPSRRAVLLFAVGLPIPLLVPLFDAEWWPFSLDYSVLVLIAIGTDALLAFPRRLLDVATEVPAALHMGESGRLLVTIAATGHRRATRFALLCDHGGPLAPPPPADAELEPGRAAAAGLDLVAERRGQVTLDRLWLRWHGPLALVQLTHTIALDRRIDVFPNVRAAQGAALQFHSRDAVFGLKVQRERGEGAEYESLRDYSTGDDPRFIDWKHSARHRKLLVKEFVAERNHHVVLAYDTGHLMREPLAGMPRLDHAINSGLLLAWAALRGGDLVGSFAFDAEIRQYVAPVRGIQRFGQLEHASAGLAYGTDETNFTRGLAELAARLKRRALVVLFTDFVDTVTAELMVENMSRLANRHLVVFVTLRDPLLAETVGRAPADFRQVARSVLAFDLMHEREVVFERLERIGVQCLDVPAGLLPMALLNRYLTVKQRNLL